MSIVALGSVRSCGATTLGCALAATWPEERRVLLVEADPAGGTLAAAAGWPPEPGLVSLAAASRRAGDAALVVAHCHTLPGGAPVLCAPAAGEQARRALSMLDATLRDLGALHADVLLDCGRLEPVAQRPESPNTSRFAAADLALLVARPRLADLHALLSWCASTVAADLASSGRLGLVLVGDGPYPDAEVADALRLDVLGHVPFDPESAAHLVALPASGRQLRRAPLVRAARSLAARLAATVGSAVAPTPAPTPTPEGPRATATPRHRWRTSAPAPSNGAAPEGATNEATNGAMPR